MLGKWARRKLDTRRLPQAKMEGEPRHLQPHTEGMARPCAYLVMEAHLISPLRRERETQFTDKNEIR